MATRKITFDPDAGVPVASNLTIYGNSDFNAKFNVVDVSNVGYGFTDGWSVSSQMIKSAGIGATTVPTATFTSGINTITKSITVSLANTITGSLDEGRYVYDIEINLNDSTVEKVHYGIITVHPQATK